MLKANELRTGNYLNFNVIDKPFQITAKEILIIENGQMNDSQNYYFEPIPLTKEWLTDFGFEKGICYYSFKGFDIDLNGWMGFQNFVFQLSNIKYVHQLQNLYFALTGEEITRKEDQSGE